MRKCIDNIRWSYRYFYIAKKLHTMWLNEPEVQLSVHNFSEICIEIIVFNPPSRSQDSLFGPNGRAGA